MKKVVAVVIATLMMAVLMTGCTESEQVSYNIGKEADNFNVTRKLTVINARTDTILLEMEGTFSLSNNSDNELEVICEVGDGKYQKHFVYLNDDTMYVVEDIGGAKVNKYKYEVNYIPESVVPSTVTNKK